MRGETPRMKRLCLALWMLLLCAVWVEALPVARKAGNGFIRVSKDKHGPVALELSVPSYRSKDGRVSRGIWWEPSTWASGHTIANSIATLKITTPSFTNSSRPAGRAVNGPFRFPAMRNNPLSVLQSGLKDMLGLSFQLDEIDYNATISCTPTSP